MSHNPVSSENATVSAMTTHGDMARDQVEAVRTQADLLDELYGSRVKPDPREVAAAHQKLGQAIKLAEVHALIHIGDQLEYLVGGQ